MSPNEPRSTLTLPRQLARHAHVSTLPDGPQTHDGPSRPEGLADAALASSRIRRLSEALEQLDEQVYEPHEHVEDDLKDLHDDVGRVVESARPAENQRQDQYHGDNQQYSAHVVSPPAFYRV